MIRPPSPFLRFAAVLAPGAPFLLASWLSDSSWSVTLSAALAWLSLGAIVTWRLLPHTRAEKTVEAPVQTAAAPDVDSRTIQRLLTPMIADADALASSTDKHQDRTSQTTSAAAAATEKTALIAEATATLDDTISIISRRADEATETATHAVKAASEADASVNALAERAQRIMGAVDMIREIARRTHMLALNASIEAVHAGEHGRGFNIVATEVKELAGRTTEATALIEEQTEGVKESSDAARQRMRATQDIIGRINETTEGIRDSLKQQRATTSAIADHARATTGAVEQVNAGVAYLLVTTEDIRTACVALGDKGRTLSRSGL